MPGITHEPASDGISTGLGGGAEGKNGNLLGELRARTGRAEATCRRGLRGGKWRRGFAGGRGWRLGEWAVGSSLLAETWPKKWRHWIAAVLQTGVSLGVLLAAGTGYILAGVPDKRYVFLVGVLPALIVFWIRRNVPEPEEWHTARAS